jgi:hypothetical protein
MVIDPLLTPGQAVGDEVVVAERLPAEFTVAVVVVLQRPVASVTWIVCNPGPTLVNVYGLGAITGAPPSST